VRALWQKRENMIEGRTHSIYLTSVELAAASGQRISHPANAHLLVVGIYHEPDQLRAIEQLAPFLHKVEKTMTRRLTRSVQIDLMLFLQREYLEKDLNEGQIDIIRIGEGPLVRLRRDNSSITPLVQQNSGGKTSVVIVARSSPITTLAELIG